MTFPAPIFAAYKRRIFPCKNRAHPPEGYSKQQIYLSFTINAVFPVESKSLYPYFIQALKNLLSENESRNAVEILENTLDPLYPEYSHDIACLIDSICKEKVIKKSCTLRI